MRKRRGRHWRHPFLVYFSSKMEDNFFYYFHGGYMYQFFYPGQVPVEASSGTSRSVLIVGGAIGGALLIVLIIVIIVAILLLRGRRVVRGKRVPGSPEIQVGLPFVPFIRCQVGCGCAGSENWCLPALAPGI